MAVEQLIYEYSGAVVTPAEGTRLLSLVTAGGERIKYVDGDHIEVLKSADGFQTVSQQLYRPADWDFTYVDASIIELVNPTVSGETYILRRVTPLESLMEFADGALLTAEELEKLRLINLYRDQELHDYDLQLASDIDDVANGIDPTPPPDPPDEILPEQASQMLLQLGGNPVVGPTSSEMVDPLNAMYTLYVDPSRGQDDFVTGSYATFDDGTVEAKLKRMEQQRLRCGYTEAAPFKTLNRAVIEAAIITSKAWMTIGGNQCGDLVSIIMLPGVHEVLNGPGTGGGEVWTDELRPTNEQLQHFNTAEGGVVLPRGCSLCGMDLRKVILRPSYVPAFEARLEDWSNQVGMLRTTGGGYYFGFTFIDRENYGVSHHLLSAFKNSSQAELDTFYAKILGAFGPPDNTGNLRAEIVRPRPSEYEIVGPLPPGGGQDETTDTVKSASPYIFNCSIRSEYGLGGCLNDGNLTGGFDSIVIAQFTGVSLQKDLRCWDKYDGTVDQWISDGTAYPAYADYISEDPNNVRSRKGFESAHIVAKSDAFIQEVSVFAIGQSFHHLALDGGEITITNSNSTFGGAAAVAEGYQSVPEPLDTRWSLSRMKVPYDISETTGNVDQIIVGTIESVNGLAYTVATPLEPSDEDVTQPKLLTDKGYSFRPGSYVWIENPNGLDWRATVSAGAWDGTDTLTFDVAPADQNGDLPGLKSDGTTPAEIGRNIYIRRIVDTRSPEERRCSLILSNSDTRSRRVPRDYVVQLTVSAGISSGIPEEQTLVVTSSAPGVEGLGALWEQEITMRRARTPIAGKDWVSGGFYRTGSKVNYQNKHWACVKENRDTVFNPEKWSETFVWLDEDRVVEDFFNNEFPILVYDNDTDGNSDSDTLGYDWATAYTTDPLLSAQYESGVDVLGVSQLLEVIGFTPEERQELLKPRARADRLRDTSDVSDMLGYSPQGGVATGLANWPMEFRRPSIIRLFGHAWEWAGFANYTKALPDYQRELTPQNLFSYYFGVQTGGRVYGTGFNEQGFQVTQAGLVDLSTGKRISVENVGSIDVSLDEQTVFNDVTLSNPTITGSVDMGDVTNITWPPSANANETRAGISELATNAEVQAVFLDPLAEIMESDTGARRVVPLESLRGLKSAVLQEVQLLETRYAILYVDGSISRSSADQPADVLDSEGLYDPMLIPDEIWTDIKGNRQAHELTNTPWSGVRPSRANDAEVFELASEVCFPTVNMACEYLANRDVVDKRPIRIMFYGTSLASNHSRYSGRGPLVFQNGQSHPTDVGLDAGKGTPHYLNGWGFRFGDATAVTFKNLYLNGSGTIADPDQIHPSRLSDIRFSNPRGGVSSMEVMNFTFTQKTQYTGWIILVRASNLLIHRGSHRLAPQDGSDRLSSVVVTCESSADGTPNMNTQGQCNLFRCANLQFFHTRDIVGSTSTRRFEVNYIQRYWTRNTTVFSIDSSMTIQHQQSAQKNRHIGGEYVFNIDTGPKDSLTMFSDAGVGSPKRSTDVSLIHTPPLTEADVPAEGNPLYDCIITCSLTNQVGSWDTLRGIVFGSGIYYNFSMGFSDERGFLRRLAVAMFNGTALANKDNRESDRIAALRFSGGAVINEILRVNRGWYPLDTAAGFTEEIKPNPGGTSALIFEDEEMWVDPLPLDESDKVEELDYPEPVVTPQDPLP